MIDLHYVATPNGWKPAIMLEEVGLPYRVIPYDMFDGEQLTREFRKLNPNNKLPVIVDHDPAGGGGPLPIFESGAILLYLAEKTGKLLASDVRHRSIAQQWLVWQVAGLGPMLGQAHHFVRYAPEILPYPIERYLKEARRLMNVLEYGLRGNDYLAGDYSIADIACFAWVRTVSILNIDLADFPNVQGWLALIEARPAVIAVLTNEALKTPAKYAQARARMSPEEWSNMFGDRMHAAAAN